MADKKKIKFGFIYTITEYLWHFLLSNFYFLIMNVPFIYTVLVYYKNGAKGFDVFSFFCMIPIGPALVALFSVMGELVREKDVQVTKKFFKAHKSNFFEALFFWCMELGLLVILYTDILYWKTKGGMQGYNYLILFIVFVLFSMSFYIFPIISRFYLRVRDVLRLSFIYSIKKIHITILNYIILIGVFMLQTKISIFLLFMWSIFCYLVMFYERKILEEIQYKLNNSDN